MIAATESPSAILSDLRVPEDESPWIVRHNFSYIRSEHPDREGSLSYDMDRRGSFALCAMARPFSNLDEDGNRTFQWLKDDLGSEQFIIGFKVYDESNNIVASNNYELTVLGSMSLVAASAVALSSVLLF